MEITLVVGAIILYLIISSYFKRFKKADEMTLRPMSEWAVLVTSGTKGNAERMSYSLIIQAESTLVKLGVLPHRALRDLMSARPEMSKLSFVVLVKEATFSLRLSDIEGLERSNDMAQARTHFAECIELILLRRGRDTLERIANKACSEDVLLR